jgi:AraC-like DNA-binding protein
LRFRVNFGHIFGHHGRKLLVPREFWLAYQRRMEEKSRTLHPPAIQNLLKKAYTLKERLDGDPALTRLTLAREIHMDPSYLTCILNLTRMAPEIQTFIQSLPPTKTHPLISDRQWTALARIHDHVAQLKAFDVLKATRRRNLTTSDDIESQPVKAPELAGV